MNDLDPITPADLRRIREAPRRLAAVRDTLRAAGAPRAADYVARAIASAEGAVRHAERRPRVPFVYPDAGAWEARCRACGRCFLRSVEESSAHGLLSFNVDGDGALDVEVLDVDTGETDTVGFTCVDCGRRTDEVEELVVLVPATDDTPDEDLLRFGAAAP